MKEKKKNTQKQENLVEFLCKVHKSAGKKTHKGREVIQLLAT